jgi:hypothetical protein
MPFEEIWAAESSDPLRIVETGKQELLPDDAFAATELVAGGSLIEQDLIIKANAGAMLTFAVWSLPVDVVTALFKDAPAAFQKAYHAAFTAYGLGECR